MTNSKVLAWILLILVIGAVIFSVVSMYHGRLEQAMLFTPLLFVIYIFGIGMHRKTDTDPGEDEPEADDEDTEDPSDHKK